MLLDRFTASYYQSRGKLKSLITVKKLELQRDTGVLFSQDREELAVCLRFHRSNILKSVKTFTASYKVFFIYIKRLSVSICLLFSPWLNGTISNSKWDEDLITILTSSFIELEKLVRQYTKYIQLKQLHNEQGEENNCWNIVQEKTKQEINTWKQSLSFGTLPGTDGDVVNGDLKSGPYVKVM